MDYYDVVCGGPGMPGLFSASVQNIDGMKFKAKVITKLFHACQPTQLTRRYFVEKREMLSNRGG